MALTNYTNLKTTLEAFSGNRTDILSQLDTFIGLTEAHLWRVLRIKEMQVKQTGTVGTSDRFQAFPTGFVELRKFSISSGGQHFPLTGVAPESMHVRTTAGRPADFTITSQFEFDRTPDTAYSFELDHFAKLTGLSSGNATNAVITNHPSLYLDGCLWFLFRFAMDGEKAGAHERLFRQGIQEINAAAKQARYGSALVGRKEGSTP